MKKIGIMSMHRITNYGSFLQAYSLKKLVESFKTDVQFVDFIYEKDIISKNEKRNIFTKIKDNLNVFTYIKKRKQIRLFKNEYKLFIEKYLNVHNTYNFYPKIDTLIIGSDEVFNCMQQYPVGYSRNLFGKGYEYCNVISYAASFGYTTLEMINEKKVENELKNMLSSFSSISVRDENSKDIIIDLISKKPYINLDPVLIGDFTEELSKIDISYSNYIVLYAYTGRLSIDEEKYIKRFAKKHNKIIISLGFYQKIADYNLVVNPFEVLKFIDCADFVITDTFHGSVFSIKMNTKFCTIVRKNNYNKLNDLLCRLGHKNQIAKRIIDIENVYEKNISFIDSNKLIKKERDKTIDYLKKNI